ncbi:hypothetical protein [Actinophytocola sp.]|uniref:hypothetical protein n=1 Tax=Actinophytocola sp. TaxID=1872138 RepID=UPI003D6C2709
MSAVMALVAALVAAVLVMAARPAWAADEQVAAETASVDLAGPVGIAAVALGFGGLVAGLLRHRRRDTSTALPVSQPVAQRPGDSNSGEHAA